MRILTAGGLVAMLTLCQLADAQAHGIARVRKELTEQGYDQLDFQRRKPPFKLDACQDGTLYHLHVDFYGKIVKRSAVGDCEQEPSSASAPNDGTAVDGSSQASPGDQTNDEESAAATSETTTDNDTADEPVSDDAIARCWRHGGGAACRSLEQD